MTWCCQFGKIEVHEGLGDFSLGKLKGLTCMVCSVLENKYRRQTTKGQPLECLECVDKHVQMLQQYRSITNNVQQL